MGNQQVGGVGGGGGVVGEPGSRFETTPHVGESHLHASAYNRLRRLSLVGSNTEGDPFSKTPSPGGGELPSITITEANVHSAHLPQISKGAGSSNSRINQLLGISTPTNRRRGSVDVRDASPSKGMINNLLNKDKDRDRFRFPSGGPGRITGGGVAGVGRRGRRASIDVASTLVQGTVNATTRITPDFKTLLEESGSDGEKMTTTTKAIARTPSSSGKNRVSKAKDFLFPLKMRRGSIFDQGISIKALEEKDKEDSSPKVSNRWHDLYGILNKMTTSKDSTTTLYIHSL